MEPLAGDLYDVSMATVLTVQKTKVLLTAYERADRHYEDVGLRCIDSRRASPGRHSSATV